MTVLYEQGYDVEANRARLCHFLDELEGSASEYGYSAQEILMTWAGDLGRHETVKDMRALIGKVVRNGFEPRDVEAVAQRLDLEKIDLGEWIDPDRYAQITSGGAQ